jgi:hypothetical protein
MHSLLFGIPNGKCLPNLEKEHVSFNDFKKDFNALKKFKA